jgi:aldehyde dehydrogenase (NAD+)
MANVSTTIKLPSGKSLTVPTGLFINNQFVPAVDGSTLETINPATEEVICSVSAGVPTSYSYTPIIY